MNEQLIALWITSLTAVVGVIYSIIRNGRSWIKYDTELKTELKKDIESIKKVLDDPHDGLGAIRREVSAQREHCGRVTSEYGQRLVSLEKKSGRVSK
jgi:hypothetical protein